MEEYKITSTSKVTAECDEIVLRSTSTTRLVFKPLLLDNPKSEKASIKGYFVFQKKSRLGEWENLKNLNLSNLRANEWVKLELKSEELLHFMRELTGLYRLYRKEGIPFGETRFLKVQGSLEHLSKIRTEDLEQFFLLNKKAGLKVFSQLLNYAVKSENAPLVVEKLERLDINSLQQLNTLVGISNLKKTLNKWRENQSNPDEEFWQNEFLINPFILSQIFPYPVILLKDKAYVGGKTIDNTGSNLVDFLCKNDLTQNAVLIEIKTPATPLVSSQYRNVYNVSKDLSGSVVQISNYRHMLSKEYYNIMANSSHTLETFHPHCAIIIGNIKAELNNTARKKSFELFRNGLKDIQILTYDELFGKLESIINLMEGFD